MNEITTLTLLERVTAAAQRCPWGPFSLHTADWFRAQTEGDDHALAIHRAAADAASRWNEYRFSRYLLTLDAHRAEDALTAAMENGTVSPDHFTQLAREAATTHHIAAQATTLINSLAKPDWYTQPLAVLDLAVAQRQPDTARFAEQLLTDARQAISEGRITGDVVFELEWDPVSINVIQRWAKAL